MRISDWSSDVCPSDLHRLDAVAGRHLPRNWALRRARLHDRAHGQHLGARDVTGELGDVGVRRRQHQPLRRVDLDHRAVLHDGRSEEHTSELQSLMRISYAVFCLKKKTKNKTTATI